MENGFEALDMQLKCKTWEDSSKYFYLIGFLNWYNLKFVKNGTYINDLYVLVQKAIVQYDKTNYIVFERYFKEFIELQFKQFCEFMGVDENGKIRK